MIEQNHRTMKIYHSCYEIKISGYLLLDYEMQKIIFKIAVLVQISFQDFIVILLLFNLFNEILCGFGIICV